MREFILYSRKGWTAGNFPSMLEGGRMDTVYQCILTSMFLSHRIRRTNAFHAILNGPPNPPGRLMVDGRSLHDVRVDEGTWEDILRKVLSGGEHPGVSFRKESFQALVGDISSREDTSLFVLEERGNPIEEIELLENCAFVVGDHVGLPRAEEKYVLRTGQKVSIGKARYLSSSVIDIINYNLDKRGY